MVCKINISHHHLPVLLRLGFSTTIHCRFSRETNRSAAQTLVTYFPYMCFHVSRLQMISTLKYLRAEVTLMFELGSNNFAFQYCEVPTCL